MGVSDGHLKVDFMKTSQMVMVPGLLSTAEVYRSQTKAWGGSVLVAETRLDDTIEGMAWRLLERASDRFLLCGHSMGGYVALEVLRLAPERVSGLALIATSAWPDTPEQTALRGRLVQLAQDRGIEQAAKLLEPKLFAAGTATEELRRLNISMSAEIGTEVFVRQQAAIIGRRDQRPLLATIGVATIVVSGTADAVIPAERSHEMAAAIPAAELVMLGGIGHMVPLEAPQQTDAALATLAARVAAA